MGFCFVKKIDREDPLKIMARHEFVSSMPLPNLERMLKEMGTHHLKFKKWVPILKN